MKDSTTLFVVLSDMLAGNGHVSIAEVIKSKCEDEKSFKRLIDGMNELRNTPLHWAVLNRQKEFVQFLLDNRADANIKNSDAKTPLDLAVEDENDDMVVWL